MVPMTVYIHTYTAINKQEHFPKNVNSPQTLKHAQCGIYIRGYLLTDILFVLVFGIILVNKTFQQMKEKNKESRLSSP